MTTIDDKIDIKELGHKLKIAYDTGIYPAYVTNALKYASFHKSYAYFDVLCEEYQNKHPAQFDENGVYK